MKIPRIYNNLEPFLLPNKALIIYGPRRVGKTTLLSDFLAKTGFHYRFDSGDNLKIQHILSSQDFDQIREYAQGYELIAIDEAQMIPSIGQGLKILVDQVAGIRVIATGSSSFELSGQVGEPLTGRKQTLTLYPVAQKELTLLFNRQELRERLPDFLVYGAYPEILQTSSRKDKERILEELVHSYLLKDILALEQVKGSKTLLDLLRLLAFQIGGEVSMAELASSIGRDAKTVSRYLDLFEKSFIIYNVRGFSRNLRKEITKKSKYYFYDIGIRNALIANFNNLEMRNDVGVLWENFLFIERMKKLSYEALIANRYFWRTWDQYEVDYVEEREGALFGYEFKWSKKEKQKNKEWLATYPNASLETVSPANYFDFVT